MRTAITVGIASNGAGKLLAGPEVSPDEQRRKFYAIKMGDLPKGIARVELWESNGNRKVTVGIDRAAQRKREADEKAQSEADAEPNTSTVALNQETKE